MFFTKEQIIAVNPAKDRQSDSWRSHSILSECGTSGSHGLSYLCLHAPSA